MIQKLTKLPLAKFVCSTVYPQISVETFWVWNIQRSVSFSFVGIFINTKVACFPQCTFASTLSPCFELHVRYYIVLDRAVYISSCFNFCIKVLTWLKEERDIFVSEHPFQFIWNFCIPDLATLYDRRSQITKFLFCDI